LPSSNDDSSTTTDSNLVVLIVASSDFFSAGLKSQLPQYLEQCLITTADCYKNEAYQSHQIILWDLGDTSNISDDASKGYLLEGEKRTM
jgi:hypothetical protein